MIKVFSTCSSLYALEKEVNEWIQNNQVYVRNIQYSQSHDGMSASIVLLYDEKMPTNS